MFTGKAELRRTLAIDRASADIARLPPRGGEGYKHVGRVTVNQQSRN
jgi:hypothetical protein